MSVAPKSGKEEASSECFDAAVSPRSGSFPRHRRPVRDTGVVIGDLDLDKLQTSIDTSLSLRAARMPSLSEQLALQKSQSKSSIASDLSEKRRTAGITRRRASSATSQKSATYSSSSCGARTFTDGGGGTRRSFDTKHWDSSDEDGNGAGYTGVDGTDELRKREMRSDSCATPSPPCEIRSSAAATSSGFSSRVGSVGSNSVGCSRSMKKKKPKKKGHQSSVSAMGLVADGRQRQHSSAVTWTPAYTEVLMAKSKEGDPGSWHQLMNLEQLFNLGMLSDGEYQARKRRLIDTLTGTVVATRKHTTRVGIGGSQGGKALAAGVAGMDGRPAIGVGGSSDPGCEDDSSTLSMKRARMRHRLLKRGMSVESGSGGSRKSSAPGRILGEIEIKKDHIPKWDQIRVERAIRHSCTIVGNKEDWKEEIRWVKISEHPFDHGSLRYVYYMQDITEEMLRSKSASLRLAASLIRRDDSKDAMPKTLDSKTKKSNSHSWLSSGISGRGDSKTVDGSESLSKKRKKKQEFKGFLRMGESKKQPLLSLERDSLSRSVSKPKESESGVVHSIENNARVANFVAKIAIDPLSERDQYFMDVAMQKYAQRFADMFNQYEVPKKIGFLDCWVYELVDRTVSRGTKGCRSVIVDYTSAEEAESALVRGLDHEHVYCGVERLISGDYTKYTNNWDYTVERNTPQSFSHFTYEASEHRILICDLQGVGDLYTDPQMHSHDGKGAGMGNMGQRGIDKFLSNHKCNAICSFLRLPKVNPQSAVQGTLPSKRRMDPVTIDTLPGVPTEYSIPASNNGTLVGRNRQSIDNERTELLRQYREHFHSPGVAFGKFIDDDDQPTDKAAQKCCCSIM